MNKKKKVNKENQCDLPFPLNLKKCRYQTEQKQQSDSKFNLVKDCSFSDQKTFLKQDQQAHIEQIQTCLQLKYNQLQSSNIQALKKHAKMLDQQVNLGRAADHEIIERFQQKYEVLSILKTIDMNQKSPKQVFPKFKSSQNNIYNDNKKKSYQNFRKVAKGRPQLYNWVRKYKQRLALNQAQPQTKVDYQTQALKKKHLHTITHKQELNIKDCKKRYSSSSLIQNYANKIKLKSCHTSKSKHTNPQIRSNFVQRLKTLQQNRISKFTQQNKVCNKEDWKNELCQFARSAQKNMNKQYNKG